MLEFIRVHLRRFILGSADLDQICRQHQALVDPLAEAQQELSSHRGRLRALENDVIAAKSVAERLRDLDQRMQSGTALFTGIRDTVAQVSEAMDRCISLAGRIDDQVEGLSGRLRAAENRAAAAYDRCERIETRLKALEAAVPAAPSRSGSAFSALPLSDEDANPPTRPHICPTCRGVGSVAFDRNLDRALPCSSCGGTGSVEAVPA